MSRIEEARRRVSIARYAIGIGAAAALAAFAAVARQAHPATHHATPQTATAEDTADGYFLPGDDGSASIGPSGGAAPQIMSGAS